MLWVTHLKWPPTVTQVCHVVSRCTLPWMLTHTHTHTHTHRAWLHLCDWHCKYILSPLITHVLHGPTCYSAPVSGVVDAVLSVCGGNNEDGSSHAIRCQNVESTCCENETKMVYLNHLSWKQTCRQIYRTRRVSAVECLNPSSFILKILSCCFNKEVLLWSNIWPDIYTFHS